MKKFAFILFCLAFGIFVNSYASVLATMKEDQYKFFEPTLPATAVWRV